MMKTFIQWAEENKLDIPVIADVQEAEPTDNAGDASTKTVDEKTKRGGYSANYPAAYVRGQYPHKYFNPIKATADLDASFMKDKK